MPTNTSPTRAKTGDTLKPPSSPASGASPKSDSDNTASALAVSPAQTGESKIKKQDFPEGGGSGGAQAYRRRDK